jgi:ABC-2 type transport system permease protein
MAVYEQSYGRYAGPMTPERSRFLVIPRYAYEVVFKSKMFVAFVGMLIIYLHHNLSALNFMGLPLEELAKALPIDNEFFWRGLWFQGGLGFLMVFLVGPALVAPDLRINGLPLYLSRPFSRTEYVLGKMSVLVILLSAITWVPGLLLFFFQGYLEGAGWIGRNLWIAWALLAGSWVWIVFLSLFALAVSAWVKWKAVARMTLVGLFFILMGFANALYEGLDSTKGLLLSAWHVIASIWWSLFRMGPADDLPPAGASWVALAVGCLIFLWLLSRRIRAYEVVG